MCYYGVRVGVEQAGQSRTDGWKDGLFEGKRQRERQEGGVGHLIRCSKEKKKKKQRCSLQMSAAFSGAPIEKKSARK